jgi:flagellar biosynthesis protein FlhG
MRDGELIERLRPHLRKNAQTAPSRLRRTAGAPDITPVFAIASGKGGVGKTNVTANLATALAGKGRRVLAIDADVGLANLDLLFGVKPALTLQDFFSGAAALDQIVLRTAQGVFLLPGVNGVQSLTALSGSQKLVFNDALETVARQVDIVLVDTCSGISDAATYFAAASQEIIVLVTPEPASLTDAYALIKLLASTYGEKRFQIVTNKVDNPEQSLRLFDALSRAALRFLNVSVDYLGAIPRDPLLLAATSRSRLVVEEDPDAPSAHAFHALAGQFIKLAKAGGRVKGNLQFFSRQLFKEMEGT